MRIDKFLKVSRVLKRRSLGKEACEGGKVIINGKEAKPSSKVAAGDIVQILFYQNTLTFKVLQIKETVKKDEAQSLYEIIV